MSNVVQLQQIVLDSTGNAIPITLTPYTRGNAWIQVTGLLQLALGPSELSGGEIVRNDADPEIDSDHSIDAVETGSYFQRDSFDTVILDPPWNSGIVKRRELYNGEWCDMCSVAKDGVARVTRPGGRVIAFGFDSSALGEHRGFTLREVAAIHFTRSTYDVTATVERLTDDGQGEGGRAMITAAHR